ncbi:pre-mRNA-splicing factor cwc22 [Vanrija albida]|uniref:Pre-mRNA-splicing factor cwc22 n=1 Tax=Vanrija albida TaxID=181172 RepID=A0ABR3Q0Q1_9TREE
MPRSESPRRSPSQDRAASRSPSPEEAPASKRKRSPSASPRARSPSPPAQRRRPASPSPGPEPVIEVPRVHDVDPVRKRQREAAMLESQINAELKGAAANGNGDAGTVATTTDARAEFAKLLGSRSGGAYIPPARLRAMQAEASKDKSSPEYQRLSWDALRKSINGLINKVNVSNIKHVIPELFGENLIRGKGLFARSIMRAQASSLPFTPIFAALVAIVNTKLPQVGELVLTRLIAQFRRAYKRNDKTVCNATSTFIAHLVNQYVAHEIVALQILLLCLERPTDDSIEVAVGFMREVGLFLQENSPRANTMIYERFRAVLHEGAISKRCQYMIEVLFQVRKDKYKDNPSIPEGLDLVEEEEQITHRLSLDDELKVQEGLNLFKVDPNFLENEERYQEIKKEILGDSDDEDESGSGSDYSDDESEADVAPDKEGITDMTETNLMNLRRTIYLTIMNSLNFEEAVHKLLKVNIPEGNEIELCNMIVECCSQERSYSNFYGLIGERFCKLNRLWTENFQEAFQKYYETIHRYETNKLRNIGRFFGHLLASDAISWAVLHVVHMNEEETTSSSRIFVKIFLQEMKEEMGMKKVVERFKIPDLQPVFANMFPTDNPRNTRFAINYFTQIGLGAITEDMRTWLQNAPKLLAAQHAAQQDSSDSDSSSDLSSDLSSSSDSSDYSSDDSRARRRRSPPRRRRYSSDSRDDSRSPPPRRRRYSSDSRDSRDSRSPSPAPRRRDDSPPRKRPTSDSPRKRSPSPRRNARDDSRTPPRRRDDSPPPRRRDDSPPARRRDDSPPRRRDDSPPPRRRESPPPRAREPSPPRAAAPPVHPSRMAQVPVHPSRLAQVPGAGSGPRRDPPPHQRRSPPRRRFDDSPPRRRFDDGGRDRR